MKRSLPALLFALFLGFTGYVFAEETDEPANSAEVAAEAADAAVDEGDAGDEPVEAAEVEAPASIAGLKALVDVGEYKEAYTQGQEMLFDFEGEREFDLLYGTAANEVGESKEAAYIFERLVEEDPSDLYAQLELGKAYYQLGNKQKAKRVFEGVLLSDKELPANVEAKIVAYLDAIESGSDFGDPAKKEKFKAFIGIAAGYDSNANGATSADTINRYFGVAGTNGYTVSTPNGTEEESTSYLAHQIALAYVKPLNEKTALDFKLFGSNRNNMDDDLGYLDPGSAYFELGNRWRLEKGLAYFALRQTGVKLGHDDLYDHTSFIANWSQALEWEYADSLNAQFTHGAIRYTDTGQTDKDIDVTALSVGLSRQIDQWVHSAGLQYGMDSSTGRANNITPPGSNTTFTKYEVDWLDRDYYGLNYTVSYIYDLKTAYYGGVSYQSSSYDNVDLVYTNIDDNGTPNNPNDDKGVFAKRDGTMTVISAGARYKWNKSITIRADISTTDVTSDIDSLEYSRDKIEVGAGYQL